MARMNDDKAQEAVNTARDGVRDAVAKTADAISGVAGKGPDSASEANESATGAVNDAVDAAQQNVSTGLRQASEMVADTSGPLFAPKVAGIVTASMEAQRRSNARERILDAAYQLFSRRGIRAVGVDELIAASGVANATFYRHFESKDALVLAFLERREELWTLGTIVSQALARAEAPKAQLLAIFDIFDEWFQRPDFEGDPFITILLEMGPDHPLGRAASEHLDTVREMVRGMASAAGLREPDSFAHSWHILMKGAIITARMGDLIAAQRAKEMGRSLVARFSTNDTADDEEPSVKEHATSQR